MPGGDERERGVWWRDGVFYQIYPRSFADSNGDGIGDLPGVVSRLDYLAWLGVDAIWLNPVTVSPDADWGYDVADYFDVHPELGAVADVSTLVAEAAEREMRVLFDIVPNHTSDRHPWFLDSRSSRSARRRDWYVWADPKPDGSPPNNWLSVFGGPAWTLDEVTGQYYLHNFLPAQPDLNWWNEEVRDGFDEILRFWFDRGIAGFRIDVAHGIVKDRELRDNLPVTEDDHPHVRRFGQRRVYSMNRPEVHEVFRRWRAIADEYEPQRILVGETYVLDLADMAAFYGSGEDELHLAFNFPFVHARFEAEELRRVVAATEALIPPAGWPVWTASNHDVGRLPTRWCGNDEAKARCALMALVTLRGTPVLYYGDEIAMRDTPLAYEDLRDPVGLRFWPENPGRDSARTPMHWSPEPGAGFTEPGAKPWLPLGDHRATNVAAQRADDSSFLRLCRDLIALRRSLPELQRAPYEPLPAPPGAWAWRRGSTVAVALNLSDEEVALAGLDGTIRVGTRRERDGEAVRERLLLRAWEGAVLVSRS